jgi:hypothetical protein
MATPGSGLAPLAARPEMRQRAAPSCASSGSISAAIITAAADDSVSRRFRVRRLGNPILLTGSPVVRVHIRIRRGPTDV